MTQLARRGDTSSTPHPRQLLPLLHMHILLILLQILPLPLPLRPARGRRTRPRTPICRLLVSPSTTATNLGQLPIRRPSTTLLPHLLNLLIQPFLQQLLPHPTRILHRTRIIIIIIFPPLLARIRRPAPAAPRRAAAAVHARHGGPTRRAPGQTHALLQVLCEARDEQAALARRTRVPRHVLALLQLLVDLARLLLALLQRPVRASGAVVVVARGGGRGRRRPVLRRVFARGRAVVFPIAVAVLGRFALLLGGRAAGHVRAREGVVVDVVSRAAGPGLALAVLRAGGRVGGRAADFGREGRVEQAREFAVLAVRELVGRVQVG